METLNRHLIKQDDYKVIDKPTFKKAPAVERTRKKVEKCKLDISFLVKCQDGNLQPTFTRVKHKGMDKKIRNRYYRLLLLDEISNKYKRLKLLTKRLELESNILNDSPTWMKGICIRQSINIAIISYVLNNQQTHNKKFDSLCKKKQQEDGIKENPNNIIWNLTSQTLPNDEYQVLRYGLNHGLKTHQIKTDILANTESIWDQINGNNVCKESNNHVERTKNSLRAMAFSLIDLGNKQIFKD